jgi:signal peptide peptidase SppA
MVPSAKAGKFTAMVSLHGVALYDLEYQPYCFSTSLLAQIMDQLGSDPMIDTIVLDINTPGGHVTGTQEAADAVWAARKKKTVIGIVNPLCASAGYWIGSQCSKLIGVPSADIGSIGVFMTHYDCSAMLADAGIKPTFIYAGEHKVEGNSMEPLGADAQAWFQSEVDGTYKDFLAAVARGRGISADQVEAKFGKGRCYGAPMAKKVGMIDEVATIKSAFQSCGLTMTMPQDMGGRRRGEGDEPEQAAASIDGAAAEVVIGIDGRGLDDQIAQTEFMSEEGCEPCSFTQVTAPGVITTYAAQPWPAKVAMTPEFLASGVNRCAYVNGETITVAVANGAAVYTKIGESVSGNWICTLEPNSSYEPMSKAEVEAPVDPTRLSLEVSDEFKAEAAASANRTSADAYRRRLAILGA